MPHQVKQPRVRWDRLVPWLVAHELRVFLTPLLFLIVTGAASCAQM